MTALFVFGLLNACRSWLLIVISNWMDDELAEPALALSFDQHLIGNRYGTQSLKDVNQLKQFLCGPGSLNFFDVPWTPIYLLIIFMLHPVLGWFSTFGTISLFLLALLNEYATRDLLDVANTTVLKIYQKIDSALRNADVVQAMGMLPGILKKWQTQNQKVMGEQAQASSRAGIILASVKFIRLSLQLGILGVGAYLAIQAEITPGAMIAASIIMAKALAPVEQGLGTWKQWVMVRQSYHRLDNLLSAPSVRVSDFELPEPKGLLQVEDVSFAYPNHKAYTLMKVSFAVRPAETVAVIGPTAAGKSTLARLIVGALPPAGGTVRLDGANLFKSNREMIGKYIGYLPQDIELFSGTVKENIARMGEPDDTAVLEAAQLADVHELILRLPDGYETNIGEAGSSLSGGQKQRLGLARALYNKPMLIVLDEPNSNLDVEGESALMRALESAKGWGATVLVIAQKPSILKNVDRILVLKDGQIIGYGPRDEVLEKLKIKTSQ